MNVSLPETNLTLANTWMTTGDLEIITLESTTHAPISLPEATSPPPQGPSLGIRVTIIAYCYILPVICVLGIIGNLMNLVTLASRRLRAVSYLYLRALATADLLCMIFVLIFVSGEILNQMGTALNRNPWFGFYQAHLMLSLINWALATGVYVVVALSLERYVSVVFPIHFRAWNSPKRACKAIFVAYSVPALFYIPYAFGRYSVGQKQMPDGRIIYMAIDSDISKSLGWQIYKWTRETFLRFMPIMVLSILNLQIMMAFRKRQKMFARLTNREKSHVSRDDTLLYILGGIVAMFFVCNIPAAMNLLFINEAVKKRVDYQIFRAVANLLEITNHAAQFYIFCVCSTDYRVTFIEKFPLPCFRAYYFNKHKFCSILRRIPKDSTERFTSASNNTTMVHTAHRSLQTNSSTTTTCKDGGSCHKRSTTATMMEAFSISGTVEIQENYNDKKHIYDNHNNASNGTITASNELYKQEQTSVQLASGEEDISDESDILLNYNVVEKADEMNRSANGTTYL